MNHELVVLDTAREVASLTARTIADLLGDFASESPSGRSSVAFSGGNTPTEMLGILAGFADDPRAAEDNGEPYLDWATIDVFQVDERIAPPGDEARNLTALKSKLLDPRVPATNVHPIPVELGVPGAASAIASTLVEVLGESPSIDVVHLGLGADGHCASLVPGDPVLEIRDSDVATTLEYQGHRRVTLTYPALERAGVLVWQVIGESKAIALARMLDSDPEIPAGRVRARRSIVIADAAAGRGFGGRSPSG